MRILLFKGRGLISRLIRWQTRSQYSHAAILLDDGTLIESWQGSGVRLKRVTDWSDIDVFSVSLGEGQAWQIRDFLANEIGRGYDYVGVLRFITRRKTRANRRWFCSELVFAAFQHAGVNLLERIEASAVSPALLALAPKLTRV